MVSVDVKHHVNLLANKLSLSGKHHINVTIPQLKNKVQGHARTKRLYRVTAESGLAGKTTRGLAQVVQRTSRSSAVSTTAAVQPG